MSTKEVSAVGSLIFRLVSHPREGLSSVGPTLHELTFGLLGSSFRPQKDIGDLAGKVILVTGGNTGLGKETILQLAKHHPSRIYIAARNEDKSRNLVEVVHRTISSVVDVRFIKLDLASFESIRSAANQFLSESDRLDLLILNAGAMGTSTLTTEEGYEAHIGTNHIGHTIETAPDVRVVTLTSMAHKVAPPLDVMLSTQSLLDTSIVARYGASKAANILFASELARRYPKIMSVSVHPGIVSSGFYEMAKDGSSLAKYTMRCFVSPFMRSVRTGAMNQLFAAGAKREFLTNGAYYTPIGVVQSSNRFTRDAEMAKKLWEWTEEQVSRE